MVGVVLFLTLGPSDRSTVQAQSPGRLTVIGRLLRVRYADTTAMPGQWVVAHRIGERMQGPIDSQRTDAAGRFRFVLTRPDSGDVIVVSSRHQGIGYFSEPVQATDSPAPPLVLALFDTTTTGVPLRIGMRHLVLTRETSGARRVLDIFQVENPEAATRVGADSLAPVWRTRLPEGIERPQAGESDLPPNTLRFENGEVLVSAPFPPGLKQVVVSYDLSSGLRRLVVPVDQPTERFEVFVEDSAATAEGGLSAIDPVTIEGRTFRRYGADSLAAGATPALNLSPPGQRPASRTWIVVVVAALALAALAWLALKERPAGAPAAAAAAPAASVPDEFAGESAERLTAMLAALDDRFAGQQADTPPDAWRSYQQRRAALKAALKERLARA